MKSSSRLLSLAAFLCFTGNCLPVAAQTYPVKPVRLVISYAPGGSADFVGRIIAQKLSDSLGQQVLPDNRAGANGHIAVDLVTKTPADGYTLLLASEIQFVINPAAFEKMRQELLREFDPITLITVAFNLLVVNPSLPIRSVQDLVSYAKANPGKLNYASPGTASPNHLAMEYLALQNGIKMTHVPYKSAGQALPDVIAGNVQAMLTGIPATLPHLKSGRVRVLGIASPQRLTDLPDIPTVAEGGFPGFESSVAWSLFSPAGTPPPIINRIQADVARALTLPDVRERFATAGLTPIGSTPAQLAARLKEDQNKWPRVIREAGIKVEP